MRTITIKKSYDFSAKSKVYIYIRDKQKIHINGFGPYPINIEEGDSIFASHQWAGSNIINYDQIEQDSSFIIKPRLDKKFAFIFIIIFALCTCLFLLTRFRWSFLPLALIALYIFILLSFFRNKYLIIKPFTEEE